MSGQPTLTGVHLFVRDMSASIAFYRKLGLTLEADSEGSSQAPTCPEEPQSNSARGN